MAYNQALAERVRNTLADLPLVEEKKMFGGLAFMVDGKMCINVSQDRMMCRIDPALYENTLSRTGCEPVFMGGREYKGYVYVSEAGWSTQEDFDYWIQLALAYNKHAQTSTSKKK